MANMMAMAGVVIEMVEKVVVVVKDSLSITFPLLLQIDI